MSEVLDRPPVDTPTYTGWPVPGEHVLMSITGMSAQREGFHNGEMWFYADGRSVQAHVSHWRPLPVAVEP